METKWSISEHGDWLEIRAADFIRQNIPAYEEIWKRYIGHNKRGSVAEFQNPPSERIEKQRRNFAQHHYTILESLFFMKSISENSEMKQVSSFEEYTTTLNNLMAFQAYAGRIRDNMYNCFLTVSNSNSADLAIDQLEKFYQHRHVFVHGKKVPFTRDIYQLFLIASPRDKKGASTGYGDNMLWEEVSEKEFVYNEDYLRTSLQELYPIIQGQLSTLIDSVKGIIENNNLQLREPAEIDSEMLSGGTTASSGVTWLPGTNKEAKD